MTDRRMFYVTGMHRSGTSAFTRVINLLGASVGPPENLMPPQADNPTGFWEVRAVARLNEEILASRGGSWRSPPVGSLVGPTDGSATESPSWTDRMIAILDQLHESGPGPFVLKDPRFAWTMQIWESVAPPDLVVVAIRTPEEVCASLRHRNAMTPEEAASLWLGYVRAATSIRRRRIVVDYAHLLETPDETARGVAASLGLPAPSSAILQRVREFVDPELHHARTSQQEPQDAHLDEARRLYQSLAADAESVRMLGTSKIGRQITTPFSSPDGRPESRRSTSDPHCLPACNSKSDVKVMSAFVVSQPHSDRALMESDLKKFALTLHDNYLPTRPPRVPFPPVSGAFFSVVLAMQEAFDVRGDVLEIGVEHGGSALFLLQGLRPDERLFLIDLVRSPVFDEHLAKAESARSDDVEFILGNSVRAVDHLPRNKKYRFIHIDGSHEREGVRQDLRAYSPLLSPEGVLCLDDFFEIRWPQVTEAVFETLPEVGMVPFALVERKLYACSRETHAQKLEWLQGTGSTLLNMYGSVRNWTEPLLGSDTWIAKVSCDDMVFREPLQQEHEVG